MSIPRLGVNIDHVATLRQARGETYPSVVEAAHVCFKQEADQLTIHLREDRRHIQDTDVDSLRLVCDRYGKPMNLEMGVAPEMIDIAIAARPEWICLVPEKREERTTEGGLNLADDTHFNKVKTTMKKLRAGLPQLKISLFVEANETVLKRCIELKADAVEIHTGDFAMAFNRGESVDGFMKEFEVGKKICDDYGVAYHAGHGLTDVNIIPLLESKLFAEYNIGHWIISQAVFEGLNSVVDRFKKLFEKYPLG
jgi:pyridoxine 5-phosphate synthase